MTLLGAFICGFLLILIPTLLSYTPFISQVGVIIKSSKHSFIIWTVQGKFFIDTPNHLYHVGDLLFINGTRSSYHFANVEGGFNYATYLQEAGVFNKLDVIRLKVLIPSLLRLVNNEFIFNVNYPSHLEGLRNLLLIRTLDYKDPLLHTLAQDDLIFLITMTGAHLSFIRRLSKKTLFIFINDKQSEIGSYIVLMPLFLLNITKFAFYRIFLSGLFIYVNKYKLNNYFSRIEVVSLLAFMFLLINPFLLFNAAFYLSFSLIFLFTLVRPPASIRGRLQSVLLVWLVIVPYKMFNGGILNLNSLILPFLMTPFVSVWFLTYVITLPLPFLQNIPITILNGIYHLLGFVTKFSVTLYFKTYSSFIIFISLLLIITYYYARLLKLQALKKRLCMILCTLFVISFIPLNRYLNYRLSFINVGQGDSFLLETRHGNILVDTGGLYNRDVATEVLIPFFYRNNIYKIHYLIVTHDDFDHNGGVNSLSKNFNIGQVITEKEEFPLEVGPLTLYNLNTYNYGDDNLDSLIIYFSLPRLNVLLMGDAGVINEAQLINDYPLLDVDILKVGHHGSNTSTSTNFIKHYQPKVAIISCGYNNRYGHPHQDVLRVLRNYNVRVRRTDLEGTITLKSSII